MQVRPSLPPIASEPCKRRMGKRQVGGRECAAKGLGHCQSSIARLMQAGSRQVLPTGTPGCISDRVWMPSRATRRMLIVDALQVSHAPILLHSSTLYPTFRGEQAAGSLKNATGCGRNQQTSQLPGFLKWIAVGIPVTWYPPQRPGRALISASGSYLG
jgi:hypothetical protein